MGFIPLLLLALLVIPFVVGFSLAGRWYKTPGMQVLMGMLLGVGFLAVLGAVAFGGCLLILGPLGNMH